MDLKEKALLAVDALEKEYPEAQCLTRQCTPHWTVYCGGFSTMD